MISDKVYQLCTSTESVSALLAQDPTLTPGEAWEKLYGHHAAAEKESISTAKTHRDHYTPNDLIRARECGNWGPTQPSDLFLRVSIVPLQLANIGTDFEDVPRCIMHLRQECVWLYGQSITDGELWYYSVDSSICVCFHL